MIKKIKRLIKEWKEKRDIEYLIDSANIKQEIRNYLTNLSQKVSIETYGFTKVELYRKKKSNTILLDVTLEHPGILIGRKGKTINALIAHMKEYLINEASDFKIKLTTSKIWQ